MPEKGRRLVADFAPLTFPKHENEIMRTENSLPPSLSLFARQTLPLFSPFSPEDEREMVGDGGRGRK